MNTTNKVDWNAEVAKAVLAMKEEGQKAYTYMKSEASEIAQEYVRWQIADSSIKLAIAGAVLISCGLAARKVWKLRESDSADFFAPMAIVLLPCVAVISFLIASEHAIKIAKCLTAPRIVIIEGIKSIVR